MPDDLRDLDRRITDALNALRCARAGVERSATSTTRWHEDMAEQTLNRLLERRRRSGGGEPARALQTTGVSSRPDR